MMFKIVCNVPGCSVHNKNWHEKVGHPEDLNRQDGYSSTEKIIFIFFIMYEGFDHSECTVKGRLTVCDHFNVIFSYVQCKNVLQNAPSIFMIQKFKNSQPRLTNKAAHF